MKQSTLMRFCRLWRFSITSESLSCKACLGSFFHERRKHVTKTVKFNNNVVFVRKTLSLLSTWKSVTLNVSYNNIVISINLQVRNREKNRRGVLFSWTSSTLNISFKSQRRGECKEDTLEIFLLIYFSSAFLSSTIIS